MSRSTQVEDIVTLRVLQPITISATLRKKIWKIMSTIENSEIFDTCCLLITLKSDFIAQYTMGNFVFKTETFYAILYSNLYLHTSD